MNSHGGYRRRRRQQMIQMLYSSRQTPCRSFPRRSCVSSLRRQCGSLAAKWNEAKTCVDSSAGVRTTYVWRTLPVVKGAESLYIVANARVRDCESWGSKDGGTLLIYLAVCPPGIYSQRSPWSRCCCTVDNRCWLCSNEYRLPSVLGATDLFWVLLANTSSNEGRY